MTVQPIDVTTIIVHLIGIFASYFFGKRRGRSQRKVEPLSEKDLDEIDRS